VRTAGTVSTARARRAVPTVVSMLLVLAACSDGSDAGDTTTTATPTVGTAEIVEHDLGVQPLVPHGAFGAVWVLANDGDPAEVRAPLVARFDPATGDVTRVGVGIEPSAQPEPPVPTLGGVASDASRLYAAIDTLLVRIDPRTRRVDGRWTLPEGANCCLAADHGVVWVVQDTDEAGVLTRVDTTTGAVARFPAPRGLKNLTAADDDVWVTDVDGGLLVHYASDGRVVDTVPVRPRPAQVSVGLGGVWVTSQATGSLERVDPASAEVVERVDLNLGPAFDETVEAFGLTIADGTLWVALRRIDDGAAILARVDPESSSVTGTWRYGLGYTHELAVVGASAFVTRPFTQLYFDADELSDPGGADGPDPLLEVRTR
jgi:streptogramin lyase